jgi:hypothetical protein
MHHCKISPCLSVNHRPIGNGIITGGIGMVSGIAMGDPGLGMAGMGC